MRALRLLGRTVLALVALVVLLVAIAIGLLRGSLPRYDGEVALPGLARNASVTRDALGVVTIEAGERVDAMRALGYVHAQERWFEMDLTRRAAAGELSELFGTVALPMDRARRPHRFRARASAAIAAAPPAERMQLDAYVDGVNAGLADLAVRPFPFLLLRQAPVAWRAEDSLLCGYAMFFDLQGGGNQRELAFGRMQATLPPSLLAFLSAAGTEWDAPLDGEVFADPPIPPASDVDLRTLPKSLFGTGKVGVGGDFGLGSNSFAVAGSLTGSGAPIVANDMHLQLRVPNIWFRTRLRYAHASGAPVDITGVTLPGVPAIVVGSNGHVAWTYTNSYIDAMDWVRVHWLDAAHTRYRGPDGNELVATKHAETLGASDGTSESLEVVDTVFGPVLAEESKDVGLALAWIAHREGALNFALADMEAARDVDAAVSIAHRAGVPTQNFVVGDTSGRIVYTLIGRVPARSGFDRRAPADFVGGAGWSGWVDDAAYPRVEPSDGRLWTANTRTISGSAYDTVGDGGYALGARARQIRDGLRAKDRFTTQDLLAIQLDDRTLFMRRWYDLLRATLARSDDPSLAALSKASETWDEHASVDARSYRFARAFRLYVHEAVLGALVAPMRAKDPDFEMPQFPQAEGVVWKLVQERPAHLLAPIYADWDALLVAAAQRIVTDLGAQPGGLAARTWGERNTTAIRHPLSRAVPFASRWLDMPKRALPGDSGMPRVQAPAFGASERFAVSPGREAEGFFHMPGGQSGHPMSPYYGAGHEDWELGRPTPFLPGAAKHTLLFKPAG